LGLHVACEPDQFADLGDLFLEWQLRELLAHLGFHFAGSFKLCLRRMSSSSALSILACDIKLFDAGQVFVPPDADGDGNEVFGTENVCRYAFVFYQLSTFFRRTRTQ